MDTWMVGYIGSYIYLDQPNNLLTSKRKDAAIEKQREGTANQYTQTGRCLQIQREDQPTRVKTNAG